MNVVSVLIPFRPDGGPRDRLYQIVYARAWKALVSFQSNVELVILGDDRDDPDLFNHGQAINRCAEKASGDVFLIMDADTTFDHTEGLREALHATCDDRRWRLPTRYIQLTETGTQGFLENRLMSDGDVEWVGESVSWSGLVIVPREAFALVGGADERYVGHGGDDVALGQALDTLYGKHVRYPGAAVHLWHPRDAQARSAFRADLTLEYNQAAGDPVAMRKLLEGKRL